MTRPAPPPAWEQHRARLAALERAPLNYDPSRATEYTAATGWRLDDYETDLPAEAPGPPQPGGPWERAREVVRHYEFPPPGLVTGIYAPDTELEGRGMLIRARFLGFTFWFGVRITDVVDGPLPNPDTGAPEQVSGYSYRTLSGHFEKGEIRFTVHKDLTTGRVRFRIHAYSQPDRIANPFYRLGFRLFGRRLQRRFAQQSLARMRVLVGAA